MIRSGIQVTCRIYLYFSLFVTMCLWFLSCIYISWEPHPPSRSHTAFEIYMVVNTNFNYCKLEFFITLEVFIISTCFYVILFLIQSLDRISQKNMPCFQITFLYITLKCAYERYNFSNRRRRQNAQKTDKNNTGKCRHSCRYEEC